MYVSDVLSHVYIPDDSVAKDLVVDMEVRVHSFIKALPLIKGKLEEMQQATSEDNCLVELQRLAKYG